MSEGDGGGSVFELQAARRLRSLSNSCPIRLIPMIVRVTNKFSAEVMVEKDDEQVNGKSIMGLMMLAAGKGSKVSFHVTGDDAEAMLNELAQLFERKFDEA